MAQVTSIGGRCGGRGPAPGRSACARHTDRESRVTYGEPRRAPPARAAGTARPAASCRLLPPPLTASRPAVASASGCPAAGAEAGRGGEE